MTNNHDTSSLNRAELVAGHQLLLDANSDRTMTAEQLRMAMQWFARVLGTATTDARPRIALVVRDRFQAAQWTLLALLNECVVNPLNPDAPEAQLSAQLEQTAPHVIISDDGRVGSANRSATTLAGSVLESVLTGPPHWTQDTSLRIRGDLLLYTSGTTANPKGVLLRAAALSSNVATAVSAFGYEAGWTTASILPLFHSFTIVSDLLTMLAVGGRCVVCDCCTLASLPSLLETFQRTQVESYSAVPLMFRMLARFWPQASRTVRFAVAGAAPLGAAERDLLSARLGHSILACYGMTEACCFITITPPGEGRAGSVGLPHGIALRVLEEDGSLAPQGAQGEIAIRGPSVMSEGYFSAGGALSNSYSDGFLLTGDIGRVDEEGWVYITGRKKNMMIKAGEKVYLEDVEQAVLGVAGVQDCACIVLSQAGREDDAACFVVSDAAAPLGLEPRIRDVVRMTMGGKAVPGVVHFVAAIPRTPTGKAKAQEIVKLHAALDRERHDPSHFTSGESPNVSHG